MSYIVSYRKNITRHTTESLLAPEGSTELCLLPDGFTYVSIPDDEAVDIEAQPESVRHTLDFPVLTPELVEAISQASTHVQLINERVRDMIAQQYPMCEEIKLLRTAPSEEFDIYNAHVEACRQWGREQKALLGL